MDRTGHCRSLEIQRRVSPDQWITALRRWWLDRTLARQAFRRRVDVRFQPPRRSQRRPFRMKMDTSPGMNRRQPLQPTVAEYATFKLIGLGGVGAIVARYGAMYLASLGSSA